LDADSTLTGGPKIGGNRSLIMFWQKKLGAALQKFSIGAKNWG
jgi:hypothetical protein